MCYLSLYKQDIINNYIPLLGTTKKNNIMPCNHRFQEDLYPQHQLKYLFVGTFNPEWDNPNGNNANWFYGRRTNSFWNIMPRTFGHPYLNNPENRLNPEPWKQYCFDNDIGLTDMIETILDANEQEHQNQIISF